MNYYTTTQKFESAKPMNYSEQQRFEEVLYNIDGIIQVWMSPTSLMVEYYSQLVDESFIMNILSNTGFRFKQKNAWNFIYRFIERMAESNKQIYGDKKLDCCDLNE